jgi:ABC-type multidrug transport system fused ATPase/permease subunit
MVNRVFQDRFRGHTVIAVAHKLEFAMSFNRIATMDAGIIVEFDTPEALLGRASLFRSLYESENRENASE